MIIAYVVSAECSGFKQIRRDLHRRGGGRFRFRRPARLFPFSFFSRFWRSERSVAEPFAVGFVRRARSLPYWRGCAFLDTRSTARAASDAGGARTFARSTRSTRGALNPTQEPAFKLGRTAPLAETAPTSVRAARFRLDSSDAPKGRPQTESVPPRRRALTARNGANGAARWSGSADSRRRRPAERRSVGFRRNRRLRRTRSFVRRGPFPNGSFCAAAFVAASVSAPVRTTR